MNIYKNKNSKLFPNLSYYNRAVGYPYFAPDYSFSFYKGKFVKDICYNLDNRVPILSIGSNRSPYQLKKKFSLNQELCVTPATLFNSDIVFAASLSAYGSIPATQWPSYGTKVDLNVLWLREDQLNTMHLTEGLGIAYDFVKLKFGSVKFRDFDYCKDIFGYTSLSGALIFNNKKIKRLSDINAHNSKLESFSEYEALMVLKKMLAIKDKNLSKWLFRVVKNKQYRVNIQNLLKAKAKTPKIFDWEILKIKIKGNLVI